MLVASKKLAEDLKDESLLKIAQHAFGFANRRINLSSIHMRP